MFAFFYNNSGFPEGMRGGIVEAGLAFGLRTSGRPA
jgi:hypothetical protein